MIESKYTRVRVNNEVELCETYEREIKDKIEKAFVRTGVSFFIKWKRERNDRKENGKYIIFVNQYQKQRAEAVIHELLEDVNDDVTFADSRPNKNWKWRKLFQAGPSALLSKM